MINNVILLLVSLVVSTRALSATLPSREIYLSAHQWENIQRDLPINEMIFENENLWLLGRRNIWKWNVKKKSLKKVKIFEDSVQDNLKNLAINDRYIFVSSNDKLFRVSREKDRVVLFESRENEGQSLNIIIDGSQVYWIKTNEINTIIENNTIKSYQLKKFLPGGTEVRYIPSRASFWYLVNSGIKEIKINEGLTQKHIFDAGLKLFQINQKSNETFVSTKYTVLRFDTHGDIVQTLPIEGNRKLVLMLHKKNIHLYLFNDKLVEYYDIEKRIHKFFRLKLGRVKKATRLVQYKSYIGLLLDGNPRVFQFSGRW